MNWSKQGWDKSGWPTPVPTAFGIKEITLSLLVKQPLKCYQVGDLAICYVEGKWQVAHVPTSSWFSKAVPLGTYQKESLLGWCAKVQQELRPDWQTLATLTHDNFEDDDSDHYRTVIYVAKERILEYCRSVPVI